MTCPNLSISLRSITLLDLNLLFCLVLFCFVYSEGVDNDAVICSRVEGSGEGDE